MLVNSVIPVSDLRELVNLPLFLVQFSLAWSLLNLSWYHLLVMAILTSADKIQ